MSTILETKTIHYPEKVFPIAIAIATGLFAAEAIIKARQSAWKGDDFVVAVSLFLGIVYGFHADAPGL